MNESEKLTLNKYDLYYESRMTKVESAIEHLDKDMKEIKFDLRWMLGIWISINGIMLALMAHGFKWI